MTTLTPSLPLPSSDNTTFSYFCDRSITQTLRRYLGTYTDKSNALSFIVLATYCWWRANQEGIEWRGCVINRGSAQRSGSVPAAVYVYVSLSPGPGFWSGTPCVYVVSPSLVDRTVDLLLESPNLQTSGWVVVHVNVISTEKHSLSKGVPVNVSKCSYVCVRIILMGR